MKPATPNFPPTFATQRGAVLIMALMFLTLLTLMGVTAMTNSSSQEKMARATRDYNTAFQAAEAALRDAENDINGSDGSGSRNPAFIGSAYWFDVPLRIPALGGCANGACIPPASGGTPVWEVAANWTNAANYGQFTFAQALPSTGSGGVGQPAKYMIEYIGAVGTQYAYRITARGYGPNSVQTVMLQEEVLK